MQARYPSLTSRFVILGGILVLQSACATIIKGPKQLINIDSNVRDAEVMVNGATMGRTPFNGPIPRGSSTQVTIKKDGYYAKTITLATETETAFWGNILIGGVLGSSTDSASGAMNKYSPATFQIDLTPIPPPAPAPAAAVMPAVVPVAGPAPK